MQRRTTIRSRLAALAVAVAMAVSVAPVAAQDEPIRLRFTTHGTEVSAEAAIGKWYMREVESRSGGRIVFEEFYLGSLCPGAETTRCVIDGRADLGMTTPSVTPADFPITELMNLPFTSTNNEAVMIAYAQLMREIPAVREESTRQGLRDWFYIPAAIVVLGAATELNSIADLEGLRVRTIGLGSQLAIEAIGANPVTVVAGEMYEGIARGVLDVWVNNLVGGVDFKLYEVSPYWYEPGMGVYVTNGMWFSQQRFDSLPEDLQAIIDEVAEEAVFGGAAIREFVSVFPEKCDEVIASGLVQVFERWPDEVIEEWRSSLGTAAVDAWIQRASDAGVEDPAAIYERYIELLREAEAASDYVSPEAGCIARM
jgi:TRAP-type transport system periplasmic protein